MKKFLLLIVFAAAAFLTSCEDDCDCPAGPDESTVPENVNNS